jgi:hypothetical protein
LRGQSKKVPAAALLDRTPLELSEAISKEKMSVRKKAGHAISEAGGTVGRRIFLNSKIYFNKWETIREGNPQMMLDRGKSVSLPPLLIMQGKSDGERHPGRSHRLAPGPEAPYTTRATTRLPRPKRPISMQP